MTYNSHLNVYTIIKKNEDHYWKLVDILNVYKLRNIKGNLQRQYFNIDNFLISLSIGYFLFH